MILSRPSIRSGTASISLDQGFEDDVVNDDDSKSLHRQRRKYPMQFRGASARLLLWKLTLKRFILQVRFSARKKMFIAVTLCLVTLFLIGLNGSGEDSKLRPDFDMTWQPRVVRYGVDFEKVSTSFGYRSLKLSNQEQAQFEKRHMKYNKEKSLKFNRKKRASPLVDGDCVPRYDWMSKNFPNCNELHEIDLKKVVTKDVKFVNHGLWRDVWMVKDVDGSKLALKTIRYKHEYTEKNHDRHRRDALVYERLSSSSHIVDIYSFCANSGLFEYSDGGDIEKNLWPHGDDGEQTEIDLLERLRIAEQVANGVAEAHNSDEEGKAAFAHTDIRTDQFLKIDGVFKLNDFNRCRFIKVNQTTGTPCGFSITKNGGKFRSPEEYSYDLESEKVDIYSMGNIFYMLLTYNYPFKNIDVKKATKMVMNGKRPEVSREIMESTDPMNLALIKAMQMCHIHDPTKRATAREVSNLLTQELKKIEGRTF